jgi:peptidylprolyl isomerase
MKPKSGDTVRVHYTGTLQDGTQFDSSQGRQPISFTMGQGDVIPGFESAVADLEVGGSVTVTIPAADAYGDRHEEAQQQVPLEAFEGQLPQEGWVVQMQTPDGQEVRATVAAVETDHIVLDFNHPLAGEDLTFALELVEIVGS